MGFINIIVGSDSHISIKNNQLKLQKQNNEQCITYPLEDINSIIIDNLHTVITTKSLIELANNNVITYFCDEKHLPQVYLLGYNSFYKNLDIYNLQINLKRPIAKNIWKNIIEQKIYNQFKVLEILNVKNELINYINKVQSGDATNVEAVVANQYFKLLFQSQFNRKDNTFINGALNYGYAIIRGAIARTVTAHGLQPFLGIHHINKLNNFNLVDDLIEPFRQIEDLYVIKNFERFNNELNSNLKAELVNILNLDVEVNNQKVAVSYAIEKLVQTYVDCLEKQSTLISLPKILPIKLHQYE